MSNTYSVYKHTFPNGKVYIGITGRDPKERWKNGKGYRTQSKAVGACPATMHRHLHEGTPCGGYIWSYSE